MRGLCPSGRGRYSGQAADERGAAAPAGMGREQGGRFRRTGGDPAQLARAAADDVGLRGDSAYQQTPGPRQAPHRPAQAGGAGVLRQLPRLQQPAGAAQPAAGSRAYRQLRPAAQGVSRPALQPGSSGYAAGLQANRADPGAGLIPLPAKRCSNQ
ncbi:hypothetical protein AERO8C_40030 [Aeromonas veronii]|uniref:Uncharacterized protein n=1 Tax=Aeromonas veronii TaxID=654 RepID=A0A653L877_AERVE|nr:hypothetical protein AERO8C_40030 [Aeromonas veronii]